MAQQELQVQQKREVEKRQESTFPARTYLPVTDIFETTHELTVVMEMPGVDKQNVDVTVENDVLSVSGRIDFSKHEGLQPPLHRVQCRALCSQLPAFQQDRPRKNHRRPQGRGDDIGAAESGRGKTTQDRGGMNPKGSFAANPITEGTSVFIIAYPRPLLLGDFVR
jgi:hypothetical protein